MLSQKTRTKMLNALNATVESQGKKYWNKDVIIIVTGAILKGKEIRGSDRRSIGHALFKGDILDTYVLEGYDGNQRLAVQILKRTAFSTTDFNYQAFKI